MCNSTYTNTHTHAPIQSYKNHVRQIFSRKMKVWLTLKQPTRYFILNAWSSFSEFLWLLEVLVSHHTAWRPIVLVIFITLLGRISKHSCASLCTVAGKYTACSSSPAPQPPSCYKRKGGSSESCLHMPETLSLLNSKANLWFYF